MLFRSIQRRFGDTDKRATMSLKIRTMMQGDKMAEEHIQDFEKAALEAFYGKANQSGAARKPQQSQAGMSGIRNDTRQSYNSYGQGGYQNRNQTSTGSATVPCQDYRSGQKDPNAMEVDRTQERRPPVKCYKCQKLGHMMKDCRVPFNIRNMMYEELHEHFDQAEAAKKDREAIKAKEQKEKDFPGAAQ